MDMQNNSRRNFIKTLALGVGALVLAPVIRIQNAVAAALVKDTDPMVTALKYVKNVDALKGKDAPPTHKKGTACKNCQFYADPKAKQAKCQLIQGGDVLATGWCTSYSPAPKAAAKKS